MWSAWVCFSSSCSWFFSYFYCNFLSIYFCLQLRGGEKKKNPQQTAKLLYLLSWFWLHLCPVLQQSENYANLFFETRSLSIMFVILVVCSYVALQQTCCAHDLAFEEIIFITILSLCYCSNLFSFPTNRLICCSTCLATEFLSQGHGSLLLLMPAFFACSGFCITFVLWHFAYFCSLCVSRMHDII